MFNQYAAYNTGNSKILTSDCPDNVWDTFVHLCINMQGLAPVGWKIVQEGFNVFFYLFIRYRLFTFRPGWRLLVGRHLFQILGNTAQIWAFSGNYIQYLLLVDIIRFCFFLSMLSITMIYTLIPCDNWAFCKADVPDGGLSSYSAKKKRINVGKDTLSVIVIYRHE